MIEWIIGLIKAHGKCGQSKRASDSNQPYLILITKEESRNESTGQYEKVLERLYKKQTLEANLVKSLLKKAKSFYANPRSRSRYVLGLGVQVNPNPKLIATGARGRLLIHPDGHGGIACYSLPHDPQISRQETKGPLRTRVIAPLVRFLP